MLSKLSLEYGSELLATSDFRFSSTSVKQAVRGPKIVSRCEHVDPSRNPTATVSGYQFDARELFQILRVSIFESNRR